MHCNGIVCSINLQRIDSRVRVGLDYQKRSEEQRIRVHYYCSGMIVIELVCVKNVLYLYAFSGRFCIKSVALQK